MDSLLQGLKPEIREYVILQQPENYEVAGNYTELRVCFGKFR